MGIKPVVTISWELLFQVINTVVLFLVLKKILFKPVLNIIDSREQEISKNIATGEDAKKEGLALKEEYEQKLASANDESQEIIKQATLKAQQKSDEIISNAKEEAQSLKEKASKEISQEKEKALSELRNDISSIAIQAASKVIEKDIDQAKHEEMINNFIAEVGESK